MNVVIGVLLGASVVLNVALAIFAVWQHHIIKEAAAVLGTPLRSSPPKPGGDSEAARIARFQAALDEEIDP